MIDQRFGGTDDIDPLRDNWSQYNLQYVAVMLAVSGDFTLSIRLHDVSGVGGADITPVEMLPDADGDVTDGSGYVTLANPSDTEPPAIPGEGGNAIIVSAVPLGGPHPEATWEIGVFMKRLSGAGQPPPSDCPPRPPWPYPLPSIQGLQGPVGIARAARR